MGPLQSVSTVTITMLIAAFVSVSLRLLVRKRYLHAGLRADDWLMVVALAFYFCFCAVILLLTKVGEKHPVLTTPVANEVLLLLAIGESVFMIVSITFKFSLTLFFLPLLVDRMQRRFIIGVTCFYSAVSFCAIFLCLLPCGAPVNMATKRIEGHCIPPHWWGGLLYTHGALSALSDWIYALLPIYTLWKSKLPRSTKMSASVLLLLAVCGSLCAVLRAIYTHTLEFRAEYYDPNHRPTYYGSTALVVNCAILELGLGITAASLACLRPLLQRLHVLSWSRLISNISCSNADKKMAEKERPSPPKVLTLGSQFPVQGAELQLDGSRNITHFEHLKGAWDIQGQDSVGRSVIGVIPSPRESFDTERV